MKMLRQLLLLGLLVAAACGDGPSRPWEIALVRATTSFGFCVGYCRTTLEITSAEAVFVREGWSIQGTIRVSSFPSTTIFHFPPSS